MHLHSMCDLMKWYRMLICFVLLLSPALQVSDTAPWLSMCKVDGDLLVIPSSQRRSLSQTTSCMAGVALTYSNSVDESATTDCSLLLQQIAPPPIIHTNPDIDLLVSTHPAQSKSLKPSIELLTGCMPTPCENPYMFPITDLSVLSQIM